MKTFNLVMVMMLAVSLNMSASTGTRDVVQEGTPSGKTESIKVWGKCEMCKARIEKTAKAEGASNATWDMKTMMLTLTYDPAKTNTDAISKKLASVGHDTEKYKAPDDVYAKLPACCHYERFNK